MNPGVKLAKDFVRAHPLAVLATLNEQGFPETAAVYCALDDDLSVYFLSASRTRKVDNIDRSPMVSLTFIDETSMSTLQVQGSALSIATPVEAVYFEAVPSAVVEELLTLHTQFKDITPAFKTGGPVQFFIRIKPTWMRLADFRSITADQSKIYTQIVG